MCVRAHMFPPTLKNDDFELVKQNHLRVSETNYLINASTYNHPVPCMTAALRGHWYWWEEERREEATTTQLSLRRGYAFILFLPSFSPWIHTRRSVIAALQHNVFKNKSTHKVLFCLDVKDYLIQVLHRAFRNQERTSGWGTIASQADPAASYSFRPSNISEISTY